MRIVMTPWGSFGDLHPYIAVGLELKRRGQEVTIATSEIYRAKVTGEGLAFHPVRPDLGDFLKDPERFADVMHPFRGPETIFRKIILPSIREMFDDIASVAANADVLVSHSAMISTPTVAEYKRLRWVSVVLQPAVLWSRTDPMHTVVFGNIPRLSPAIARAVFGLVRVDTNRWMRPLYELRNELGLAPIRKHPLFEGQFSPLGTLALFSPLFAAPQADWPKGTIATGFPFYDKLDADMNALAPELEAFLSTGPPPVVFTLGTSAVRVPGTFYETSVHAARKAGLRALLLTGPAIPERLRAMESTDVMVATYAPYSQLLPRAAATVHSGGIGTTAQALRAAKPQIVMPFSHDQPDNGARVRRLGIGTAIPRKRYTAERVAAELTQLLSDGAVLGRATQMGAEIRAERGASRAADLLETMTSGRG